MIGQVVQLLSEQDKQQHMLICAAIAHNVAAVASLLSVPIIIGAPLGVVAAMAWGIWKELGDENSTVEHFRDLAADTIGAATAFIWVIGG